MKSLKELPLIGAKTLLKLKRLGVTNLEQLLHFYPRRYLDLSVPQKIRDLTLGNIGSVKARVETIQSQRTPRKRMVVTKAKLVDETGRIGAVWFNQPFLEKVLRPGSEFIFVGKVERDFLRGGIHLVSPDYEKRPGIIPIYPETEKLSSKQIRLILRNALPFASSFADALPETLQKKENLLSLKDSLIKIHLPQNQKDIEQSRHRLALEELLTLILSRLILKSSLAKLQATPIKIEPEILKKFVAKLPFKLTDDQRRAAWQILQDMTKEAPMNRLLEGDVGSGKTVVALLAGLTAIHQGQQVAWMNPTEILANQHYQTAVKLLKPFKIKVELLTSSYRTVDNKQLTTDLIIGTHALIQKDVNFKNLGLVIVDEQHRFGVEQRMVLTQQSTVNGQLSTVPHFLSMTATPIPRTLALSIYGDLEISRLKVKPAGRPKIETRVFKSEEREKAYKIIREEIAKGRQGFIICPLIESEGGGTLFEEDKKSVETEYKRLSTQIFPHLKIGKLHGRMKGQEKEKVMTDFRDKKLDLLVSTTVVEVGIDIPNATVILIEGGDHLGLAQLHQLRGRVGRGKQESFCLVTAGVWNETTEARLKAFEKYDDGFLLAEKDLEIRGPGKLLGEVQSGRMELKIASLSDKMLIEKAKELAGEILGLGEGKMPLLFEKARQLIEVEHLE